jgi:hypothetical protein
MNNVSDEPNAIPLAVQRSGLQACGVLHAIPCLILISSDNDVSRDKTKLVI